MQAGKLRDRITIQYHGTTQDTAGQEIETWLTHAQVHAEITGVSAREFHANDQITADVNTRIRIRYLSTVTPKMRVTFGARTFEIEGVLDREGRRREMQLMCRELF